MLLLQLYQVRYTYHLPPLEGVDLPNHKSFNEAMSRVVENIRKALFWGIIKMQTNIFPGTLPDVPFSGLVGIISPLEGLQLTAA